jgi:hypothetical protein
MDYLKNRRAVTHIRAGRRRDPLARGFRPGESRGCSARHASYPGIQAARFPTVCVVLVSFISVSSMASAPYRSL